MISNNLAQGSFINIADSLLSFTYVENTGIAFGLFCDRQIIFICLSIFIISVLTFIFLKTKNSPLFLVAYPLITGGAVSNIIDRLIRGYVIDYIQLSFFPPVFNLADCCITIGTLFFMIHILFSKEKIC